MGGALSFYPVRRERLKVSRLVPSELGLNGMYYVSTDNLPRTLSEFGIASGTRLKVDDFLQNYQLVLNIVHRYRCQPLQMDRDNGPPPPQG